MGKKSGDYPFKFELINPPIQSSMSKEVWRGQKIH